MRMKRKDMIMRTSDLEAVVCVMGKVEAQFCCLCFFKDVFHFEDSMH